MRVGRNDNIVISPHAFLFVISLRAVKRVYGKEVEIFTSSLTLLVPPLDKIERAGGAG